MRISGQNLAAAFGAAALLVIVACSSDSGSGGTGGGCTYICQCACKGQTTQECANACTSQCGATSAECQKCVAAIKCEDLVGIQGTPASCQSACSGGGGGSAGSGGSSGGSAAAKCSALVDKICGWGETCGQGPKSACISSASTQLNCSAAKGVGASYDQCMSEMNGWPCTNSSAPTSCNGVIQM